MPLLLNYHRKQDYKGNNDSFHTGLIPVTTTQKHYLPQNPRSVLLNRPTSKTEQP